MYCCIFMLYLCTFVSLYMYHCIVVSLYCCIVALLYRCIVLLLQCCIVVCCIVALLCLHCCVEGTLFWLSFTANGGIRGTVHTLDHWPTGRAILHQGHVSQQNLFILPISPISPYSYCPYHQYHPIHIVHINYITLHIAHITFPDTIRCPCYIHHAFHQVSLTPMCNIIIDLCH